MYTCFERWQNTRYYFIWLIWLLSKITCETALVRQRSKGIVIIRSPSVILSLASNPLPHDSPSSSVLLDMTKGWGALPHALSALTHTPFDANHSINLLLAFMLGSLSRSLKPCISCLVSFSASPNASSYSPKDFLMSSSRFLSSDMESLEIRTFLLGDMAFHESIVT